MTLTTVSRHTLALALFLGATAAQSQIQPEPGAAAPQVGAAGNGTPVVKIATPSAKGVSHNRYTSFNVDDRNLILNNSDKIVETRLGGYIDGNGNLKTSGSASLILNEVTGPHPSRLAGYIEIAGAPAQLVIANAYGISCTGCGFINAPSVTLAAARPVTDAGGLTGYSIGDGAIDINGSGVDASGSRLNLFARAIAINAGVWADDILVAAGSGDVAYKDGTITVTAPGQAALPPPRFALDVAALGGMYANSIRLIGTERGLGVNIAGDLAALDNGFVLDAQGQLTLAGRISSAGALAITATDAQVTGAAYADRSVDLTVSGQLSGDGLIASGGDVIVRSGTNDHRGSIAAGLGRDGRLTQAGNLSISSQAVMALSGRYLATERVEVLGSDIVLSGVVQGQTGRIAAGGGLQVAVPGSILAAAALEVSAATIVNQGVVQGETVGLRFNTLNNDGGALASGMALNLTGGTLLNQAGLIQAGTGLDLAVDSLASSGGSILALGSAGLRARSGGAFTLVDTTVGSLGQADLRLNSLVLDAAGLVVSGQLAIETSSGLSIANDGWISSGGDAAIRGAAVSLNDASIEVAGGFTLTADTLALTHGGLLKASALSVAAEAISNDDSSIVAFGAEGARIDAKELVNKGKLQANSGLLISGGKLINAADGLIATGASLGLDIASFANSGALVASDDMKLSVGGAVTNLGTLVSGRDLILAGAMVDNHGLLEASAKLDIRADTLVNRGEIVTTGADLSTIFALGTIDGQAGRIGGNGAVRISGASVDLSDGMTTALAMLDIEARDGDLRLGGAQALTASVGTLGLSAGGLIDARGGTLQSEATASLRASRLLLDDGTFEAANFLFDTAELSLKRARLRQTGEQDFILTSQGVIDYSGGEIYAAGGNFTLRAAELINKDGAILHGGTGLLDIVSGGLLDNGAGRIATNGSVVVAADRLVNEAGEISAASAGLFTVADALNNDGGLIAVGKRLELTAKSLTNAAGRMESGGAMVLRLGRLSGAGGVILAGDGLLDLNARQDIVGAGLIGGRDIRVEAASLSLGRDDRIGATGKLDLSAVSGDIRLGGAQLDGADISVSALNGTVATGIGGIIAAPGGVALRARSIDVSDGIVDGARLMLDSDLLVNKAGIVQASETLFVKAAGTIDNSGGDIFSSGSLLLKAGSFTNSGGRVALASPHELQIQTTGLIDNGIGGQIIADGTLALDAGSLVNAGDVVAAKGAQLRIADGARNDGLIASGEALTLSAKALDNRGSIETAANLHIGADSVINRGAVIATGDATLSLVALGAIDGKGGRIGGNGAVRISGASVDLSDGVTTALAMLDIDAREGDLRLGGAQALTASVGTLGLSAGGLIDAQGGTLQSEATASLRASRLLLDDGTLEAANFLFDTPELSLKRARLRQTGEQDFILTSQGVIDYSGGEIYAAGGNFTLRAAELINKDGAILHGGIGLLDIVSGGMLDNGAGRIATNGSVIVAADRLANKGGRITAVGMAKLTVAGSLANESGLIESGGGLTVTSDTVFNGGGRIASSGDLALAVTELTGGTVLAVGDDVTTLGIAATGAVKAVDFLGTSGTLTLKAGSIALADGGDVRANGKVVASATGGDILLNGGRVEAQAVELQAAGKLLGGPQGAIASSGSVDLKAATIDLSAATVQGGSLTVSANAVSNKGGRVEIAGQASLSFQSDLDNEGGVILAKGLSLSAASVRNKQGLIGATGAAEWRIAGAIDNSGGHIASNHSLSLVADHLTNISGLIETRGGATLQLVGAFDNGGGTLLSDASLSIAASQIGNDKGLIDSLAAASIQTGDFFNGSGSLFARGGDLKIVSADHIDIGEGGTIAASGIFEARTAMFRNAGTAFADRIRMDVGALDNAGNLSARDMALAVSSLVSNSGTIEGDALVLEATQQLSNTGTIAGGVAGLRLNSAKVLNSGALGAAGAVTIATTAIENDGTIAAGSDLAIGGRTLINRAQGVIWVERDASLTFSESLINGGSIGANRQVVIGAAQLQNLLQENVGVIGAGRALSLDVGTARLGTLISGGDLGFSLAGDWSLDAGDSLAAGGLLSLTIGGNVTNAGRLEGGGGVRIHAGGDLLNMATGEIEGALIDLAAGAAIRNSGLINGTAVTLSADRIENAGSIFGDDIVLRGKNGIVNSGRQAVIAARSGLLSLKSDRAIDNLDGALLFSLGDIAIGGLSDSHAASLTNGSATIEAQGSISIAAVSILNERTHFSTDMVTREPKMEYLPSAEAKYVGQIVGGTITKSVTETALVTDSGEARLIAGLDIVASGTDFTNRYSTIAAGRNFLFNADSLPSGHGDYSSGSFANIALTGSRTTKSEGWREVVFCAYQDGPKSSCQALDTRSDPFGPTTTTETVIVAPATVSAGNAVVISATMIANMTTGSSGDLSAYAATVSGQSSAKVQAGAGAAPVSARAAASTPVAADALAHTLVAAVSSAGAGQPLTGSPLGKAGKARAPGLIADEFATAVPLQVDELTDGAVIAEAVSSQFALPAASPATGALPEVTAKAMAGEPLLFLDLSGLFRFAAPSATYLVETDPRFTNYASFLSSDYFLSALGYDPAQATRRLGDALYEQKLITDQLVAQAGVGRLAGYADNEDQYRTLMDNGIHYAKAFNLAPGVALSAEQMATLTSDIVLLVATLVQTPSGPQTVLAPRVYLSQISQRDLTTGGAVIAADNIQLRAADKLANSGVIRASDSALLTGTDIANSGRLDLGQRGVVSAANDFVNSGAGSISGGDVTLAAGRDLRLDAAETTSRTATAFGGGSSWASMTSQATGSVIASGNLVMQAGRDLALQGSQVAAAGDALLMAGRDLSVAAVAQSSEAESSFRYSKKNYGTQSSESTTHLGALVEAGGALTLSAGSGISVTGSELGAGSDLLLAAGAGGIDLSSVIDSRSGSEAGRAGKTRYRQDTDSQNNLLSQLQAGGDITLSTLGDVSVKGAAVEAGGLLAVNAAGIAIEGVTDRTTDEGQTVVKKSGLLSSKKTTTSWDRSNETVVASTLSGDRVDLSATGDISVAGSNVVASNGIAIGAGGAIDIGTLTETDSESQSVKIKKSGLSLSGGGLFLGVAKSRTDVDSTTVTQVGSLVGSEQGDVTLDAGKALTVTGSQVVGTGLTRLSGESVTIQNALDQFDSETRSKSSSFGVSVGVNNSVLSGAQTVTDMAGIIGAGASNDRTKAVAALAGGLAAYNAGDEFLGALDAAKGDPAKALRSLTSVDVTLGISKSKSSSQTHDETVVGSQIAGRDIEIIADDAGAASTIRVQGSQVNALGDLTLSAPGAITLQSAVETDTMASRNKSSGFSAGVQFGLSGGPVSPVASANVASGKASGTDVTHIESILSAGGTARVATPDALTLKGATLGGERVEIAAGSLSIESEQDSSTYRSSQSAVGLSANLGAGSLSGNLTRSKQSGDFVSVAEQSGILAGSEGFGIVVRGATDLKGAVIASGADAERNRLETGTLSASDIVNRERYSASSLSVGGGIGGIGTDKDGRASAGEGKEPGSDLPGLKIKGLGTVSATIPVALSASGQQSGTTRSAIAPGTILIGSGDAASLATAQGISRDTDGANAGALTRQFDEAKREEIAQGFQAAQTLVAETGSFLANRAEEQARKKQQAEEKEEEARKAQRAGDETAAARLRAEAAELNRQAAEIDRLWGGGGPGNIVLTALAGAAGGNVTGSTTAFARSAAVNVLQSYATQVAKLIADSNQGGDVSSEAARAALQAFVGCAGAAAGGSDSCTGAALGASTSVVLNYLLNSTGVPEDADSNGDGRIDADERVALTDQQARTNLVATIVTVIATATGLDTSSANLAAQIETQNNELKKVTSPAFDIFTLCTAGESQCDNAVPFSQWKEQPADSPQRRAYDEIRAQLPPGTPESVFINILEAVLWGEIPVRDAIVYAQRNHDSASIIAIWNANKHLGKYSLFDPLNSENRDTYTVQTGDTLIGLLEQRSGAGLSDFLAANPDIDPNQLSPGQAIYLPAQRYVDEGAKAKLIFVRLVHFREQNPDAPFPGVNELPAFEGEGDAIRDLNQPVRDLAYWYVNQSIGSDSSKSNAVRISAGEKGNWSKELNNPQPNTVYEVDNGSIYYTDNQGRVTKVEASLDLMTADRNTYQQCKTGKCGDPGDEGGHLIASIFNGLGEALNLVPMDANLNRGVWRDMEREWAAALKNDKQVSVTIEPVYSGIEKRPSGINVQYQIGEETPVEITIKNVPGGT